MHPGRLNTDGVSLTRLPTAVRGGVPRGGED
jgi:hypothetical protein